MDSWICEDCIHYPPSSGDGKPCCACNADDPFMSCYDKKEERLTKREPVGYALIATGDDWCSSYCEKQHVGTCKYCGIFEAVQKLAYYENLEEQGRLVIL